MGRDRKQNRRNGKTRNTRPPAAPQSSRAKSIIQASLIVVLLALIGGMAWMSMRSPAPTVATDNPGSAAPVRPVANATPLHTDFAVEPRTLNELLDLPVEKLSKVDMARMNLLCATGLPGAEKLDIDQALATLDKWAERVRYETDRHLYRVHDPRYADRYKGSQGHFRAEMLAQVLQEDLGVRYDKTAKDDFSFAQSNVAFIHGMIPGPGQTMADVPGGTCASMPVLFVAVGRRLGYPLTLSTTRSHIFARWDGLDHPNPAWREQFNCETTNGFHRFDDDYYRTWLHPITDHQIKINRFFVSLTPAEELAAFLLSRGHCAFDHGHSTFAARCYENAYRYDTTRPAIRSWFTSTASQCDYEPATPALARALQAPTHMAILDRITNNQQRQARQEYLANRDQAGPVGMSPVLRQWQSQSVPPGVPQPVVPDMQPFDHHPQPDPFRSQP